MGFPYSLKMNRNQKSHGYFQKKTRLKEPEVLIKGRTDNLNSRLHDPGYMIFVFFSLRIWGPWVVVIYRERAFDVLEPWLWILITLQIQKDKESMVKPKEGWARGQGKVLTCVGRVLESATDVSSGYQLDIYPLSGWGVGNKLKNSVYGREHTTPWFSICLGKFFKHPPS
jgi:hypothetical protein